MALFENELFDDDYNARFGLGSPTRFRSLDTKSEQGELLKSELKVEIHETRNEANPDSTPTEDKTPPNEEQNEAQSPEGDNVLDELRKSKEKLEELSNDNAYLESEVRFFQAFVVLILTGLVSALYIYNQELLE